MRNNDVLLGVAAALAAAAYILIEDNAQASVTTAKDSAAASGTTLGFKNNNPGNLRYITKNPFQGQVGQNAGYGVYDTMADGVRAMGHQLTNYFNAGYTTVRTIVNKYAPDSENNTQAYISDVCNIMTVDADAVLHWPGDELDLVMAMIYHENGSNPLVLSDVQTWINS